uniref:Retrotransposon Copia-like N-terminal domain-containing protein n=1 Tax=Nicotiana tabacum TaxID=4097 RepID=A0A1S3XTU4_TOBAC|nr:PREDICTED: uncharacterized protein LOC107768662 [Nicotiana tabacum]
MTFEENTSDSTNPLLNSINPLYMHPSKNVGFMLLPVAFDGSRYRSWRRRVLRALSVKNKVGFINGKCGKPDSKDPIFDQWERCDNIVTSWILNSLSKDLADSLQYGNDAKELWQELEDRYDQTNGAKLYQLQKEISDLSQGTFDIIGYYTKMKKLWEELNTLNAHAQCKCQCTCGTKARMHKAEQDRRLIQFLMGLNEVYTIVRGNILMMNPLPSLAQAFAILIQEEKQREMKKQQLQNQLWSTRKWIWRELLHELQPVKWHWGNSFRGNYPTNRPRPVCDYFKKPGHTKDKCYKLYGYPQDSKFNKGKLVAANVFGDYGDKTAGIGDGEIMVTRLLTGSAEDNSEMKVGTVNFAGISACSTSLDSSAPSLKRPLEIGKASDGIYYHISELCKNVVALIQIPNQVSSSIPDKNNVHPYSHLVPPVASSLHVSYHACNKRCVDSHKHSSVKISSLSSKENDSLSNASTSVSTFTSTSDGNMVEFLWHKRLGHVPFAKIKGINEMPAKFTPTQPFLCPICPMARHSRLPFPERTTLATEVFEILHADLWGPYHIATHGRHKYFIAFVVDYSRCT